RRLLVTDRLPARRNVRPVPGDAQDRARALGERVEDWIDGCDMHEDRLLGEHVGGRYDDRDHAIPSRRDQLTERRSLEERPPLCIRGGAVMAVDEHGRWWTTRTRGQIGTALTSPPTR